MTTPNVQSGWQALDFSLTGIDSKKYSLQEVKGPKGLLVMFICNHCPYVKAIADKIARDADELMKNGIGVVAIMPNDPAEYPEDSFENMKKFALEQHFNFPYVIDETQAIAKGYDAVCTPDFFGFNSQLELVYRGRLDASGREKIIGAERDLVNAMLMVAKGETAPEKQYPSMGCSIKWKTENH